MVEFMLPRASILPLNEKRSSNYRNPAYPGCCTSLSARRTRDSSPDRAQADLASEEKQLARSQSVYLAMLVTHGQSYLSISQRR